MVDSALESILESLRSRPEGWDMIPGHEPLRLAKTEPFFREGKHYPALRVWFHIVDETTVSLLFVERIPNGTDF